MITNFINELITYPQEFQFLFYLVASVILIITVVMFFNLICSTIFACFHRR